jgi:flavodoxin
MHTLVIYDSRFGNTEKIAAAIARGVGSVSEVRLTSTSEATSGNPLDSELELLFVGGPTQNHRPSAGLKTFLDTLPAVLHGIPAACFDTRYRGPVLLMGSAASAAAKALAKKRAEVIAPPESFFIVRHGPMERQTLEPGEIERAEAWGPQDRDLDAFFGKGPMTCSPLPVARYTLLLSCSGDSSLSGVGLS